MRTRLISHIPTLALLAILAIPQVVVARDTDIYVEVSTVSRDDSPNVLIILDNSGSMESNTITNRPAYDPIHNYCSDTGAPQGNVCNGAVAFNRIFWSFNALTNPPASNSTAWFTTTKNQCKDSASALTDAGYYASSKIARWCGGTTCSSNSDKNWKSLSGYIDAKIDYVDCAADRSLAGVNAIADGLAVNDGQIPRSSNTSAYVADGSNTAFNWDTYATNTSPTLISANYLAYLLNNTLTTTQTRMQVARDAVKAVIDANRNVRFGLMVFNSNNNASTGPHGGRVIMGVDNMTDARRTAMKAVVDGVCGYDNCVTKANMNYTPLSETLWEAYRYYSGLKVEFGDDQLTATPARDTTAEDASTNPPTYISPFKYGCQKGYIVIVTDGDPTQDVAADDNTHIKGLSGMAGNTCQGISGTSGTAANSCLKDLAKWMYDHDVLADTTTLKGAQNIVTYTVGFGTGISADGLALLQATAQNGHGEYYTANSAADLTHALQSAISKALEVNTSFSSPSLSVNAFNRLYNRDEIYFALFKPEQNYNWDGNVKKYHLCNSSDVNTHGCTYGDILDANNQPAIDTSSKIKDTAVSIWSTQSDGAFVSPDAVHTYAGGAGSLMPAPNLRKLYTYYGDNAAASKPTIEITATPGNLVYDAAINNPLIFGLVDTDGNPATTNATDTAEVTNLINWMRGETQQPVDTSSRDRWTMGDPLHSRPVAITYGAENDLLGKPDPNKPIIKLFFGTNDGIIHMVNDKTGIEEWSFMPQGQFSLQANLRSDSTGVHLVGPDNTSTFWVQDLNNDGIIDPGAGDKIYMYMSMRRGGSKIYGFDVTPTSKLTSQTTTGGIVPKLLWVIEGGTGNYTKLGQTWSRPLVTKILVKCNKPACSDGDPATPDSEKKTVLIFAGGYDTNKDNSLPSGADSVGNAIYIVDPADGSRIWWMSSSGADFNDPAMKYSIPSDIALMDSNADGATDRLYVGDTSGQLWRIDLSNQLTTNSGGNTFGYVFADLGCEGGSRTNDCSLTSLQARRKFFYPPDIAQVKDTNFSATPYYDLVTIGSGDREDPLDLLTTRAVGGAKEAVHNRIYAIRDYNYQTGPLGSAPAIITETSANLYNATADNLGNFTGATLAAEIATFQSTKGWYIDLLETFTQTLPNGLVTKWVGEKVMAKTAIFDGVLLVTTYVPPNDQTAIQSCSAAEGDGRLYMLDYLTGSAAKGGTNRFTRIGGGIPSEAVVIIREGGTTALVGTSGGAAKVDMNFSNAPIRTYWYDE